MSNADSCCSRSGTRTYLATLDARNGRRGCIRPRSNALIRWQLATRAGALPPYDEALLGRELALFPAWYVEKHLARTLSPAHTQTLAQAFRLILDNKPRAATVYGPFATIIRGGNSGMVSEP